MKVIFVEVQWKTCGILVEISQNFYGISNEIPKGTFQNLFLSGY